LCLSSRRPRPPSTLRANYTDARSSPPPRQDTGDTRESPAATICRHFLDESAKVSIYDPKVPEAQIWLDLTQPGVQDNEATGVLLAFSFVHVVPFAHANSCDMFCFGVVGKQVTVCTSGWKWRWEQRVSSFARVRLLFRYCRGFSFS
jgi:hypothetical protein